MCIKNLHFNSHDKYVIPVGENAKYFDNWIKIFHVICGTRKACWLERLLLSLLVTMLIGQLHCNETQPYYSKLCNILAIK